VYDGQTEDVALLRLLMEELQPQPAQLEVEEALTHWMSDYSSLAPVVQRILTDSDVVIAQQATLAREEEEEDGEEDREPIINTLPFGVHCQQQLVEIRSVCVHGQLCTHCLGLLLHENFVWKHKE
jgi:hypothetical protein